MLAWVISELTGSFDETEEIVDFWRIRTMMSVTTGSLDLLMTVPMGFDARGAQRVIALCIGIMYV